MDEKMLPLIGIMIGFYIIARTLFLLIQENTPLLVKLWYVLTILVALLCMAYLFISGVYIQDLQREFLENWRKMFG
jgi:uncharacterized protein YneF (UPF0154 family)